MAFITWCSNDANTLHIYILLTFKYGKTIVYLHTPAAFKRSRVRTSKKNKKKNWKF